HRPAPRRQPRLLQRGHLLAPQVRRQSRFARTAAHARQSVASGLLRPPVLRLRRPRPALRRSRAAPRLDRPHPPRRHIFFADGRSPPRSKQAKPKTQSAPAAANRAATGGFAIIGTMEEDDLE